MKPKIPTIKRSSHDKRDEREKDSEECMTFFALTGVRLIEKFPFDKASGRTKA